MFHIVRHHAVSTYKRFEPFFPAIFFFGGFIWDALTIGRTVQALDLWTLAAYQLVAAGILWFLGRREFAAAQSPVVEPADKPQPWWRESGPYFLLQFCFGGLLSALFIFYFKSSGHFMAFVWAAALGGLLVGNEFLEHHYHRFTLSWAMFGFCAMLLLNFVVPHVVGSISGVWFFVSTLAGAGLTYLLHRKTPGQPGQVKPVWFIAGGLLLVYVLDIIPPVPLVSRDIDVGHSLARADGAYLLRQEKAPWWKFWRHTEAEVHLAPGEKLYCVSAVFAPTGLSTRLYHRWRYHDAKRGWVDMSRIGFDLSGGRQGGYRGFSWKQNLAPGEWEVSVETENGRTVVVHRFDIAGEPLEAGAAMVGRKF